MSALSTDEIRAAAGMADSTYRRARAALLASGELGLATAGGGRASTNRWMLARPTFGRRTAGQRQGTRVAPDSTARPSLATVAKQSEAVAVDGETARDAETVKGPGSSAVSASNPGQTGLFPPERSGIERCFRAKPRSGSDCFPDGFAANPAGNPATNPAAQRARGKGTPEPRNQDYPPSPPEGGS